MEMIKQIYYKSEYNSPVGKLILVSDENENLTGLFVDGQKNLSDFSNFEIKENDNLKNFEYVKEWLDKYFKGENPKITEFSLKPEGSEFRREVWKILCEIPYGQTLSYGDIAKKLAEKRKITKMSAQAIGGAVSHNPILIIIPCHRVVGSNGTLTGYSAGITTKIKLLETENITVKNNRVF